MGLFGKKEKEKCPICGKEMGFFSSVALADGNLCSECEAMLRGKYDIQRWWEYRYDGTGRERSADPLLSMTIADVQALIAEAKAAQAETVASFGGEFSDLFQADEVFNIQPKATDVGIKRAKELKGKLVARGMVQAGEFTKGDSVIAIRGGERRETTLLDVIPCSGAVDFDTELRGNIHKKTATANTNAWLILDISSGVESGDLVAKP